MTSGIHKKPKKCIFVSGLAGAGKTVAIRALEDLGYYCIDNLPAYLLSSLFERIEKDGFPSEYIALALDSRDPSLAAEFPVQYQKIQKSWRPEVLLREASEAVLIKRFRENRRLHPLSREKLTSDTPVQLHEAIHLDSQMLDSVRRTATRIVDTSEMSSHYLRQLIRHFFSPSASHTEILINVVSFGFKHTMPQDLDLIFDARCFPNPFYVEELKGLTGLDPRVRDYVLADDAVRLFAEKIVDFVTSFYPFYKQEGKRYLGIGIGCTGGRHRSVAIVEYVAAMLQESLPKVSVEHRHFDKE